MVAGTLVASLDHTLLPCMTRLRLAQSMIMTSKRQTTLHRDTGDIGAPDMVRPHPIRSICTNVEALSSLGSQQEDDLLIDSILHSRLGPSVGCSRTTITCRSNRLNARNAVLEAALPSLPWFAALPWVARRVAGHQQRRCAPNHDAGIT